MSKALLALKKIEELRRHPLIEKNHEVQCQYVELSHQRDALNEILRHHSAKTVSDPFVEANKAEYLQLANDTLSELDNEILALASEKERTQYFVSLSMARTDALERYLALIRKKEQLIQERKNQALIEQLLLMKGSKS